MPLSTSSCLMSLNTMVAPAAAMELAMAKPMP